MDKDVLCPACMQQNRPTAGYCRHCGAALTDFYQPANRVSRSGSSRRRPVAFALSGVAALALFVVAGWLARWPPAVFASAQSTVPRHVAATLPSHPAPTGSPAALASPSPAASAPSALKPLASNSAASSPSPTGPAATVQQYFAAINAKDYRTAWNLGGQNTGSSYSEFAAGFADTERDVFTVSSVSGDVVAGRLDALQTDGTTKVFGGTYTVAGNMISQFNIQQLS